MASYRIRVEKEYFNFSCAHFLIFEDGSREPLHGHNYRVWVEVEGDIGPGHYVLDYITFKPLVKKLCDELDHKMLLPARSEYMRIERDGDSVVVLHQDGSRFVSPASDTLVLDIANTSTELLANHLAQRIYDELVARDQFRHLQVITVGVEEAPGQQASYRYVLPSIDGGDPSG